MRRRAPEEGPPASAPAWGSALALAWGSALALAWGSALALAWGSALALASVGIVAGPSTAAAQDIEAAAGLRGIELPVGYWERVARQPDFFTLPHGVVAAGEPVPGEPLAAAQPVTVEVRLPVVLALFADSPEPTVSPEQVAQALFTGPAPHGTVTDFYTEASGGRFTFAGDVLPWVRTSLTMAEVVDDSYGLGSEARTGEYLLEALALNDPHIDFGLYDDDGPDGIPNSGDDDGFADVVVFEFLEVAASCGGPSIWPHRSGIANWNEGEPYVTDDPRPGGGAVRVHGYVIQGTTDCSGEQIQTAGTTAHELGHALGLPDFYHPVDGITPESRRWVLGCWALMAAGSWGCGEVDDDRPPFGPTHFIGWSKDRLGWLDYEDVGEVRDAEFELLPAVESGRALRVPLDPTGTEALLIEYRRRVSFDAELPAEGVLVVHYDGEGRLRPPDGFRYALRMAEADGRRDLLKTAVEGGNRGDAGDVFGVGQGRELLHNQTTPSIRRNTGTPSTVTVHAITVEDGRARVRLSTAPDPVPQLPADGLTLAEPEPVSLRYRIAGGAVPYAASVTGAPGLQAAAADDELILFGEPEEGAFDALVRVVDALGTATETAMRLVVGTFDVSVERLVGLLIGSGAEPLTPAEQDVLDQRGNANGFFDVGDVRAWLVEG